jgi:membrane-bound lytic murein transglycosylase B
MTEPRAVSEWRDLGVKNAGGGALPDSSIPGSIVQTGARAYLLYGNYEALLGYNCSHSYALSVALLADRIR